MLIAQITDVHLGFERGNPDELNRRRLDETLRRLREMRPLPALLLATGDLVDSGGDPASYERLREAVSDLPFPVHFALGNHDDRRAFRSVFGEAGEGFHHYALEEGPLRILVLDTVEEGRHGGSFCEARSTWLRERLAEAPERPTLIALHHPPIDSGLGWLTEDPGAAWIRRLEGVVAASPNVVALIAGHLHRPIVTRWAGTVLAVCPSTAPQVALELAAIDPERPDERPMIVADPPAFALHWWNGHELITHFDVAGVRKVMARFGPETQPLVRALLAEKRS